MDAKRIDDGDKNIQQEPPYLKKHNIPRFPIRLITNSPLFFCLFVWVYNAFPTK